MPDSNKRMSKVTLEWLEARKGNIVLQPFLGLDAYVVLEKKEDGTFENTGMAYQGDLIDISEYLA